MAPNADTNMPLAQHPPPEHTSRLEITLRSKSKSTHITDSEARSMSRRHRNNDPQCHPRDGVGSSPKEGAGASTKAGSGKSGASNRSGHRRRALLQTSSEDEYEKAALPPRKPTLFKGHNTPYHDADIDMQLENVSPEHGGSSLQISLHNEYMIIPNQIAASIARRDIINPIDATPPPNPHQSSRMESVNDTQSAKRRRSEVRGHTLNSSTSIPQPTRSKEAIPSIDILSQIWLGYTIHEAIATHKGIETIQEHRTHDEFLRIRTPPREILDFQTLRHAFPRIPQI